MILVYLLLGFVIGMASGLLGIGGGVLLVPALMWFCKLSPDRAAGTSLAILALPIALVPAAFNHYRNGRVELAAAVWIAVALAVGAFLGSTLIGYVSPALLRVLFGLMMIYIGVYYIVFSSSESGSALVGILSTAVAWLSYLALRTLGRKYVIPHSLGENIRNRHAEGWGTSDYQI